MILHSDLRPRGGDDGFSLAEMLVLLVILALCSALAVPTLRNPYGSGSIVTSAREIAAMMREARARAIFEGSEKAVRLNLDAREAETDVDQKTVLLPHGVSVKLFTARDEVVAGTVASYRFFPDGTSTGGRIELSLRDDRQVIGVDWLTGKVSRGEYAP